LPELQIPERTPVRIHRIRRSTSVAQPELRAAIEALQLAERAGRNPAKRATALAALESARAGLLSAEADSWHREAAAGQWSTARGKRIRANLRLAINALETR
jgi:hypothetical protein